MRVGVVYDSIYLKHDTGDHPENSRRLLAITRRMQRLGPWDELVQIASRPAILQELLRVHDESYISYVHEVARAGGGQLDVDTIICPASYDVALYAAGGVIRALEAVMAGEVHSAFALVRPPGHHATRGQGMGFCLFNNVAVAAACALEKYRLERVLILDFDVHHGNGTQDIFYNEPQVGYISLHQSPLYPGSGNPDDIGAGNIFNIPLPAGCGDAEYGRVLDEIVVPLARRLKPQLMLVSAGFDGHWTDALASMRLSIAGYGQIVQRIGTLASELCSGRLVLSLEGGYNLTALAGAVKASFDTLLEHNEIEDKLGPSPLEGQTPDVTPLIGRLKKTYRLA